MKAYIAGVGEREVEEHDVKRTATPSRAWLVVDHQGGRLVTDRRVSIGGMKFDELWIQGGKHTKHSPLGRFA